MDKKTKDQICETKEYNEFKLHPNNRPVNTSSIRYKNLIKSMEVHGFLSSYPLDCTKIGNNIFIRGGHNRLRAAIELNIPVKYVISDAPIEIHELETAGPGNWKLGDYLSSFANRGLKNYVILKEYCDKTDIPVAAAIALFNGNYNGVHNGGPRNELFRSGLWTIKDKTTPVVVGNIVTMIKNLGKQWASTKSFVSALSRAISLNEFDINYFKRKIISKKAFLEKQKDIYKYLEMIDVIYNHGAKKNKRFAVKHAVESKFEF